MKVLKRLKPQISEEDVNTAKRFEWLPLTSGSSKKDRVYAIVFWAIIVMAFVLVLVVWKGRP